MDYGKFSTETLEKLQKGESLDPSKLNDVELEELSKHYASQPKAATPAQEEPATPSILESFLRGAGQGATFGFGDEITGAAESLLTDKTYQQARDEARRNNEAAEAANPWTYMGGNIAGGVAVPLPGGSLASAGKAALKGVDQTMRLAKIGAAAGGLSALGASNVDAVQAVKDQDMNRLYELGADTAQGAAAGAVITPFLGQAVPGAAKGAKDWWKSMRFGRDISDVAGYAFKDPKFMTSENFGRVSEDLRNLTQNELLPLVSTEAQKTATTAYDAAKSAATGEVPVGNLLNDLKAAFTHTNPAVNSDPAFLKAQTRATTMLAQLADINGAGKAQLDAGDVYKLREEIQAMLEMASPDKVNGNRDVFNALLKTKDSIDKQLTSVGVPVDELAAKYKAVSELIGETGVDLRNVDVSKMPLRERENAEKLKRLLVTSKKQAYSDEGARLNKAQDIMKEAQLAPTEKIDDVFSRADDLAKQEYLLRSAMDESYLATDPKGYATGFGALTARGKALHATGMAAGVAGAMAEGGKKAVAAVGRAVYSATPEELVQLAGRIKDTKVASMIKNIATQPERKRKALLFAMMQNPAYREAVGASDSE